MGKGKEVIWFEHDGIKHEIESVNADFESDNLYNEFFNDGRTIEVSEGYPIMNIEYFIRDNNTFAIMATMHNDRILYVIKELENGIYGPEAGHTLDKMQQSIKTKANNYMKTHQLKCDPQYFRALYDGSKRFEVRKNDRDFNIGDRLEIFEWSKDEGHSGRWINFEITYILNDKVSIPGNENYIKLADNFVILSLKKI